MADLLRHKKSIGFEQCDLLIINDNACSQIDHEHMGMLKEALRRSFSKSSLETANTISTYTTASTTSYNPLLAPPDSPTSTMGSYFEEASENDDGDHHIDNSFSSITPMLHFTGPCTPDSCLGTDSNPALISPGHVPPDAADQSCLNGQWRRLQASARLELNDSEFQNGEDDSEKADDAPDPRLVCVFSTEELSRER